MPICVRVGMYGCLGNNVATIADSHYNSRVNGISNSKNNRPNMGNPQVVTDKQNAAFALTSEQRGHERGRGLGRECGRGPTCCP